MSTDLRVVAFDGYLKSGKNERATTAYSTSQKKGVYSEYGNGLLASIGTDRSKITIDSGFASLNGLTIELENQTIVDIPSYPNNTKVIVALRGFAATEGTNEFYAIDQNDGVVKKMSSPAIKEPELVCIAGTTTEFPKLKDDVMIKSNTAICELELGRFEMQNNYAINFRTTEVNILKTDWLTEILSIQNKLQNYSYSKEESEHRFTKSVQYNPIKPDQNYGLTDDTFKGKQFIECLIMIFDACKVNFKDFRSSNDLVTIFVDSTASNLSTRVSNLLKEFFNYTPTSSAPAYSIYFTNYHDGQGTPRMIQIMDNNKANCFELLIDNFGGDYLIDDSDAFRTVDKYLNNVISPDGVELFDPKAERVLQLSPGQNITIPLSERDNRSYKVMAAQSYSSSPVKIELLDAGKVPIDTQTNKIGSIYKDSSPGNLYNYVIAFPDNPKLMFTAPGNYRTPIMVELQKQSQARTTINASLTVTNTRNPVNDDMIKLDYGMLCSNRTEYIRFTSLCNEGVTLYIFESNPTIYLNDKPMVNKQLSGVVTEQIEKPLSRSEIDVITKKDAENYRKEINAK